MSLQGERIRQAIDRKQWVITALLQALGFIRRELSNEDEGLEKGGPPPPINFARFHKTKLRKSFIINKTTSKTKLNEATGILLQAC